MKIIIVANSPKKSFKEMYHLNPSDYFIGLDGGAMELLERRIKPDIAIGDFDSTNFLQEIEKNAIETKIFPAKKNETDLELAFMYLKNIQGATNLNIEVYDALSGRLDHELVAIRLLAKYNEYKVKLIDKENTIELLKEKKVGVVNKNAKYFSIFPIGEATISIRNAAYELNDVTISENDTYTVSNAPLKNDIEPTIYVHSGMVYLFTIK